MAVALSVATKFTAVDKFTPAVKEMTAATTSFGQKAASSFAMVSRAESRLRKGIGGLLGKFGQLGLGLGGLGIATQIASANIELEKNFASLSAITGVTGEAFNGFRKEIDKVSDSQKIFAADTAKAFELVGSAKPELLANAEALGKVTEAALILGKAGSLDVTDAVKSLTVSMNQFGVGASKATEFVDILATAQQKGSGTISFLSNAMVRAGGISRAFGNDFGDTVAILEGFAKAGVPASEAGTQLAGILSKLSKAQNKDFNPQFTKATDIINNLTKANLSYNDLLKLTDEEGAKWLTTIINQNDIVQELTGNLNDVGNAQAQAAIISNTLAKRLEQLKASFNNSVTSTKENNAALNIFKGVLVFVADNMNTIIGTLGTAIAVFGLYKTVMMTARIASFAFSFAQGLMAVGTSSFTAALALNSKALGVYKVAQWVANAALWGFPLTWIIAAVIAVGVAIYVLVRYFKDMVKWVKTSDNGFAKFIRASILPIIIGFKLLKFAIGWVVDKFKDLINWVKTSDNKFAKGLRESIQAVVWVFKALGKALSWVGDMFSKLWGWIKKIAGFAIKPIMDLINLFSGATQKELGVNVSGEASSGGGALNPDAAIEKVRTERIEKTNNEKLDININDGTGRATVEQTGNIPVTLTSTVGV